MSIACWRGRSTWTCSGPVLSPGFPSKDPAPAFLSFPEEPQGNTKSPLACLLQTAPVSCQFCSLTSPHSPVSWLVSFFCSFSPPDHLHSQRLPDQDTFLTKHHCLPIGCKSRSHSCATTLPTSPLVTPLSPLDPASSSGFHTCNSLCQEVPPCFVHP